LTKRLAAAASAVREGSRVADVGCDHGKLAAELILSGRSRRVYAIDISAPSLEKAAALFLSAGIGSRAVAMLSDGLDSLTPGLVDDVVIGGLGNDETARIISRAAWLRDESKQLVLIPSSRHDRLRRFLYENGYEIISERVVAENGRAYAVMTVRYNGFCLKLSALQAALGKMPGSGGDEEAYVRALHRRCERLISQMENKKDGRRSAALDEALEIADYLNSREGKERVLR